jgi:hypothetical protein
MTVQGRAYYQLLLLLPRLRRTNSATAYSPDSAFAIATADKSAIDDIFMMYRQLIKMSMKLNLWEAFSEV